MHSQRRRRKLRFLITAGGTREYIDPVRFISNASSGKMGYELARSAAAAGHNVTLITASTNLRAAKGIDVIKAESSCDMFEAVKSRFFRCDCLIMAAAVADYTPVRSLRSKIKKGSALITLKLKPTPDILKWAGRYKRSRGKERIVVGFSLDDKNLRASAERKLREKNMDMVVANKPSAIGADKSSVWIKRANSGWQAIKNKSKASIAGSIIRLAETFFLSS